jgi:lipoyl(octanoyl) transferase
VTLFAPVAVAAPAPAGATSGLPPARVHQATGFAFRMLGRTDYVACWRTMQAFTSARRNDSRDEIWLTEHPPVYTLGLAGRIDHVHDRGDIPVIRVDRGGQVTYHGPGQLLAYVLFDLRRARIGVRSMVRSLEAAVVDLLRTCDVDAYGREDAPGVYVRRDGVEAKIAALGLKVRDGCSYHGLALNVDVDPEPYRRIDPCGFPGLAVTSLAQLGIARPLADVGEALAERIAARLRSDRR